MKNEDKFIGLIKFQAAERKSSMRTILATYKTKDMKKLLLLPFLFSFRFCFAGTGGAKDVNQLILIIIAVMLTILAVLYIIDFFRRIIKERKEKKAFHLNDMSNSENIC